LSTSNLSIRGGTLFEVRFDAGSLEGDLVARSIDRHGNTTPDELYPADPEVAGHIEGKEGEIRIFNGLWRAGVTTTAQSYRTGGGATDNRIIFTTGVDDSGNATGRRFRWENSAGDALSNAMKADVNGDTPTTAPDDPVVDWTRGYDAQEGTGSEGLRPRGTVLGNLTHYGPIYVGPPDGFLHDPGYDRYRMTYRGRPPLVFAGGSDGMLHAFRVDNGEELFSFIPAAALGQLKERTEQQYKDQPLVGGPIVAGDSYGNFARCTPSPCWRTILAGGLGRGGRSVFALDITQPEEDMGEIDRESNAARNLFLWEFTHKRTGLTTSTPLIAKLKDGTWTVIFGSGTDAGEAALFVLDAATGELLYEVGVDSESGANGLSSPSGWDTDHDGAVDTVYAGDLEGNLWKIDFSEISADPENIQEPQIAFSGNSLVRIGGISSGDAQAITTRPLVSITPDHGLMVFFATRGTTGNPGSVYGIRDEDASWGVSPTLRVHSTDPIEYTNGSNPFLAGRYRIIAASTGTDNPAGWQLRLPRGEEIVRDPMLSNGRIEFISTSAKTPFHVESWLTGVDYLTGEAPDSPFLDLDGNGILDAGDLLADADGDAVIPVGKFLGAGRASAPARALVAGGRHTLYFSLEPPQGLPAGTINPGTPGGEFDQHNFDWSPDQFGECAAQRADGLGSACTATMSCWGGESNGGECHTASYDEVWGVDGVNMLFEGGAVASPPDVESASGILSSRQKALLQAITLEQTGRPGAGLREYAASIDDEIQLWIRNPNSVDNHDLLNLRVAAGIEPEGSEPAPPPTIYFDCDRDDNRVGENRIVVDAPAFNLLPVSVRTCAVSNITELRVRHHSINALRATDPDCVASHNTAVPPGSLGAPTTPHPNTGYRNGAFTVQAIATGRRIIPGGGNTTEASSIEAGIVIWENANYEHFGDGCSGFNEALRAEKAPSPGAEENPSDGSGTGSSGGNSTEVEGGSGSTLTQRIDVARSTPPDGRLSWLEVLD